MSEGTVLGLGGFYKRGCQEETLLPGGSREFFFGIQLETHRNAVGGLGVCIRACAGLVDIPQFPRGAQRRAADGTLDLQKLYAMSISHGIDYTLYASLNPGQQRMTLGNMIRAKRRGAGHEPF